MAPAESPIRPTIHPTAVLAPGAVLIGQVTLEKDVFIGPNAVLRGDIEPITIGEGSNVQDNVTIHTEKGKPTVVGKNVSIGHGAVVHGATLDDSVLVGMNAVVLNGAHVGESCVIGALALVPENMEVPAQSLCVGIPCRVLKTGDRRIVDMARANAVRYHRYREEHLSGTWATVTGPFQDNGVFDEPDP